MAQYELNILSGIQYNIIMRFNLLKQSEKLALFLHNVKDSIYTYSVEAMIFPHAQFPLCKKPNT